VKRAFIVTSSLEVDPTKNFKGTSVRSVFTTDQRLEQTKSTLQNLYQLDPMADVILVDSSPTTFENELKAPNLKYIQLEQTNPKIAEVIRTHSNKSHCECLMLLDLLRNFKSTLKSYDFLIKFSGRYLIEKETYSTYIYNTSYLNKYFFKKPMDWDHTQFDHMRDAYPEEMIVDNRLRGHYTVAYGFGNQKIDHFEALMALCAFYTDLESKMYDLDIEYIIYHFMNLFDQNKDVITVPWTVTGRCGVTGKGYRF